MTVKNATCEICGDGALADVREANVVELNGKRASIPNLFSVCDTCGSEQVNAKQARRNKREMNCFKKVANGLLSGSQVREIRKKLMLNQREAGQVFGGGPVAFSKYETDDVIQAESMDKLLRIADQSHEVACMLLERAGISRARIEQGRWLDIAKLIGDSERKAQQRSRVKERSIIAIDEGHPYKFKAS